MGDGPRGIEIFQNHFQVSTSVVDNPQSRTSSVSHPRIEFEHSLSSRFWSRRKLRSATSMLNLFSVRRLSWKSREDGQEKVVLSAAEVESLRSEISDLEERGAHVKAQLEHLDEILRSARMSGYLYLRTRWATLPGEPPLIDDTEVDDWVPRFLVLHGACIFLYMSSTDLSPQDSTLIADVEEVGPMPCFTREDDETRYYFYILTRHGMRYECSSTSKVQVEEHQRACHVALQDHVVFSRVDAWLATLQVDCKLGSSLYSSDHSPEA